MDFQKLIKFANNVQKSTEKEKKKPGYSVQLNGPAKIKRDDCKKGVNSASVRAFLEKQKEEDAKKLADEQTKKDHLLQARADARHGSKAHAMASRTKDNLKIFKFDEEKSEAFFIERHSNCCSQEQEKRATDMKTKMEQLKQKWANPSPAKTSREPYHSEKKSTPEKVEEKSPPPSTSSSERHNKDKHKSHNGKHRDKHKSSSHDSKHKSKKDKHRSRSEREDRVKHSSSQESKDKTSSSKSKTSSADDGLEKTKREKPRVKKRAAPSGPPPMSFEQLLQIAKKNKDRPASPVVVGAKPQEAPQKPAQKPKLSGDDRPLSQDEKDRLARRQKKEYWESLGKPAPKGSSSDSSSDSEDSDSPRRLASLKSQGQRNSASFRESPMHAGKTLSRVATSGPSSSSTTHYAQTSSSPGLGLRPGKADIMEKVKRHQDITKANNSEAVKTKPTSRHNGTMDSAKADRSKSSNVPTKARDINVSKDSKEALRRSIKQERGSGDYGRSHENLTDCHPSMGGSKTKVKVKEEKVKVKEEKVKVKQEKVQNKQERPVEPQMSAWDRIYGQIQGNHPKPEKKNKKRVIESDEDEYDDELDDFIVDDDDPEVKLAYGKGQDRDYGGGGNNYSSYIKEIFGYDKSRYRDEDDDVDNMETNFNQQMREESMSAKIGHQEDLADIRREEEELRRKKMRLKAKKMKMK